MYCDYYNEQSQCSWHYEACGELLTCGDDYISHKLEGNVAAHLHPIDAKASCKQMLLGLDVYVL